jgi:hypothetical protein
VWVGPRALVTVDGDDGYVSDEIPATTLGCPGSWQSFLLPGASDSQRNLFAVRWVNPPGAEFLHIVKALQTVAVRVATLAHGARPKHETAAAAATHPRAAEPEPEPPHGVESPSPDSLAHMFELPRETLAPADTGAAGPGRFSGPQLLPEPGPIDTLQ